MPSKTSLVEGIENSIGENFLNLLLTYCRMIDSINNRAENCQIKSIDMFEAGLQSCLEKTGVIDFVMDRSWDLVDDPNNVVVDGIPRSVKTFAQLVSQVAKQIGSDDQALALTDKMSIKMVDRIEEIRTTFRPPVSIELQ